MNRILYTLAVAILFATSALAKIIRVPADLPTIQAAINAAAKGDTVLVADGTYYENIDFKGRAITVASQFLVDGDTTHINNTIINGSKPSDPNKGSVVSFVSGEDTTSVIYGFTITGGTGTLYSSTERVGGGIYCKSSGARIVHNKIMKNSNTHSGFARGGGIGTYPFGNNFYTVIEDNVIASNSCISQQNAQGGGIYMPHGKVKSNIIHGNSCQGPATLGGGIHGACDQNARRYLSVSNNIIENNQTICSTANGGWGGGIDVWGGVVAYITDNVIQKNHSSGVWAPFGGGMRLSWTKAPSVVQSNTISFNSVNAQGSGGGIGLTGTQDVQIIGNKFEGNDGAARGGGLVNYGTGTVITGNEFIGNRSNAGGGIYCEKSNPAITGNTFRQNHASYGGGIFSVDDNASIANNLFRQNEALWGGGIVVGATALHTYLTQIINNTFAGNVADSVGAVGLMGGEAAVMNTICWGDSAAFAPEIFVQGGTLHVAYSDIQSGPFGIEIQKNGTVNWLDGNIDADPQFVADSLSSGSRCIGAGTRVHDFGNGIVCGCPDKDIYGRKRPYPAGTKPDIGAWESTSGLPVGIESQPLSGIRKSYELFQNYPNPFNPRTTIEFSLRNSGFATLKVYNLLGKEVATVVAEKLAAGKCKYDWDAKGLASGVYWYRLHAGEFVQTKKLLLLR